MLYIKNLLIFGLILLLFGCCVIREGGDHSKNCVQVIIILYNHDGVFEEAHLYIGELKKSYLPIYKGTIHNLKYIGSSNGVFPLPCYAGQVSCADPANVKWGFYQVWYGSQLVMGEGYKDTIYVRNINFLPLMEK